MTFFQIVSIFKEYIKKCNKEHPENKTTMLFCWWYYTWRTIIIPLLAALFSALIIDNNTSTNCAVFIFFLARYWNQYWLYKWVINPRNDRII
jgi:hypothetical protein